MKTENINNLSIGDTVYMWESEFDCVYKATVVDIIPIENKDDIIMVKYNYVVNEQGEFLINACLYDTYQAIYQVNMWTTVEDAFKALHDRDAAVYHEYYSKIITVEDLINFPLDYDMLNGEHEALRAYKNRAKELLNIDVHKSF